MAAYTIKITYTAPTDAPEVRLADIMAVWTNTGAWPDKVTDKSKVTPYDTNIYDNSNFSVIETPSVDPVDSLTTKFAIFDQAMKAGSVEFEVPDYESTVYFTQIGAKLPGFKVDTPTPVETNTANAGTDDTSE